MKRILIVDDMREIRELVRVTLEIKDFELLMAENGQQVLELAIRHRPDLILLDVIMPGEPDGLEVCRQLKSDSRTQEILVFLLTSAGQEKDIEAGIRAGADDYLVKPFSPLTLMRKVESLLLG